jgi:RecT family protein
MASQTKSTAAPKDPPPAAAALARIPSPNTGLVAQFAGRYNIEPEKMLETLKATAFRQKGKQGQPPAVITNEQMMALLVIAQEYGLNPFTREIYAFPSEGGIVPIIGFDGWVRLVNKRPELEYMEIRIAPDGTDPQEAWAECEIKRSDRQRPTIIREYVKECWRDTDPWKDMPRRMIRHKAIIQCARVAFGYAGVYDPDEGERVYANAVDVTPRDASGKPITAEPQRKSQRQAAAPDPSPPPAADAPPAAEAVPRVSLDQATVIADKLKEEGVALTLFLAEYQIGSLEELPAAEFSEALKRIDGMSAP